MELVEVRRLTGPNLLLDGPAAVIDVAVGPDEDVAALVGQFLKRVMRHRRDLAAAGWAWGAMPELRPWHDGVGFTVAMPAPVDELYAACEVLEGAFEDTVAGLDVSTPVDAARVATLLASVTEERDPVMQAMLAAAADRGVAGVWDDDELSVGLGAGSVTWDRADVPAPDDVDWLSVRDVPVALVTGTNGKSTTVRMLAGILRMDGRSPGNSSTDGIVVDGELVESGDWSGPGGGRTVGRDRRVGTMVLECARGGLLRRGLPLDRADVAVVTNVAADHLGEYGIETVEDLAHAKLVLAKAVRDSGVLVTNAEDALLVERAPTGPRTWWFSADPHAPALSEALAQGATVFTIVDDVIIERTAAGDDAVVAVADLPAALDGAALHNVRNALAACGAARALGVDRATVADGLRAFASDATNNPGRANIYDLDGVTIVLDFAHNVHGVAAMAALASALPGKRRLVLFSQAGDRDDNALDDLAGAVAESGPDAYVVADVPGYLRGREPMEVPGRLRDGLLARGVSPDAITATHDAVTGLEHALTWAQPGDVLLLLVLEQRAEARELLLSRGAVAR